MHNSLANLELRVEQYNSIHPVSGKPIYLASSLTLYKRSRLNGIA